MTRYKISLSELTICLFAKQKDEMDVENVIEFKHIYDTTTSFTFELNVINVLSLLPTRQKNVQYRLLLKQPRYCNIERTPPARIHEQVFLLERMHVLKHIVNQDIDDTT